MNASTESLGQHARIRAEKNSLRAEIRCLQQRIAEARNAARVPARVMAGDIQVVQQWKDDMENADHYHVRNMPAERMTTFQLEQVRTRLAAILNKLI